MENYIRLYFAPSVQVAQHQQDGEEKERRMDVH